MLERCWIDDISVDHWFPGGWHAKRICKMPGSSFRLRNHYTIYTSLLPHRHPRNTALRHLGVPQFRGNVLILRTAARNPYELTHVNGSERTLLDFIVTRYGLPSFALASVN